MAYAEAVAEAASLYSVDEVSGVHTAETEIAAAAAAAAGFGVTESDLEAVLVTAANGGGAAAAAAVADAVDSRLVSQQH